MERDFENHLKGIEVPEGNFKWANNCILTTYCCVFAAMKLRHLLLGRKVMNNLDSVLKSRDVTLSTKVRLVKAMVFLVIMY